MAFRIVENGRAILCLECDVLSFNASDVRLHYCTRCHIFHDLFDAVNSTRETPFKVGERIIWRDKEYEVLENHGKFGRVKGEWVEYPFFWVKDGEMCRRAPV